MSSLPEHSIGVARFGCKKDGNAYGWWWWLEMPNGDSVASAATSQMGCVAAAKEECRKRGVSMVIEGGRSC